MKDDLLDRICDTIQEDVGGRGLRSEPHENLITAAAGDFHRACRSLADADRPSLAVITGFFIATGKPPCCETDGPLGALFLARALVPLGVRVVLATDGSCINALTVGLAAWRGWPRRCRSSPCPIRSRVQAMGPTAYWQEFRRQSGPLTHMLAVERVGPNHTLASLQAQESGPEEQAKLVEDFQREVPEEQRDRCYSMRGRDISNT